MSTATGTRHGSAVVTARWVGNAALRDLAG
jgi:hypothetical protein